MVIREVAHASGLDKTEVSSKNVINSPGLYVNTGISAFFGNDVVFNLEDGFVGFEKFPRRDRNKPHPPLIFQMASL
jgi:hypothetical protein